MGWREEFAGRSIDYDIPESIIRMEGLEDTSWHNNACPSFGLRITESMELTIWCDAPNQDDRESGGDHRYMIAAHAWEESDKALLDAAGVADVIEDNAGLIDQYGTDDPYEAVRIFLSVLVRLQAVRAAA